MPVDPDLPQPFQLLGDAAHIQAWLQGPDINLQSCADLLAGLDGHALRKFNFASLTARNANVSGSKATRDDLLLLAMFINRAVVCTPALSMLPLFDLPVVFLVQTALLAPKRKTKKASTASF